MARFRHSLIAAVTASALLLSACSDTEGDTTANETTATAAAESGTLTVEDNHGTQEITLPVGKIAATDNRSFEILDAWGVELVAAPKQLVPFSVENYKNDDDIIDLGTHREPNLEALAAAQPDLIVNGQRFAQHYDAITKLTPGAAIVEFEPREGEALDAELRRQTEELGKIFGKESEAEKIIADFDEALERAKAAYDPEQKVMAVNVSGGTIGYIAPTVGRTYGPIFDMIGLTPALEVDNASDDHQGDDISVEAIASANPDWILVLDRDGATDTRNTDEYIAASQVIEGSDPLKNVVAIQEGQVVYAPEDTYTNESIITYTEILNGLADAFEGKN
ncbi:siderophore ABC transporter substrate-binding protein [Corynebacterium sp.]|uniref:siderophore ABC transporter substrate-binding protein n=1 Tax=Corynebacterium sp. TaxID=1720 RepID=UPI0026DFF2E5|nr:ABC transporter substrate-binding protein [Corynebacterium sp.]MDO5512727.1 ABC transporter substrate-binding protein [Corynebacterium sp.]